MNHTIEHAEFSKKKIKKQKSIFYDSIISERLIREKERSETEYAIANNSQAKRVRERQREKKNSNVTLRLVRQFLVCNR